MFDQSHLFTLLFEMSCKITICLGVLDTLCFTGIIILTSITQATSINTKNKKALSIVFTFEFFGVSIPTELSEVMVKLPVNQN